MNPPPQHWTTPSTNTLPSSAITQPPTFVPPISRVSNFQPVPHPYIFNVPTCVPLASQLQTFDGTDYQFRPKNF